MESRSRSWFFDPRRPARAARRLGVLVADGDPFVRADLEPFLTRRGCNTFFAQDGTAALRCLVMSRDAGRQLGRIDVVIADVDLPGRSGIDLLMATKGHRWDVEVVLTCASMSPILGQELTRLGALAVLAKPLSLPRLEKALAGCEQGPSDNP